LRLPQPWRAPPANIAGPPAAAPLLAVPVSLSQHGVGLDFTAGAELAADTHTRDSYSAALALPEFPQSCQLR
jgi:hypothetical protein